MTNLPVSFDSDGRLPFEYTKFPPYFVEVYDSDGIAPIARAEFWTSADSEKCAEEWRARWPENEVCEYSWVFGPRVK